MLRLITYARKIKLRSHIFSNDNLAFWVHYRLTVSLVVVCTLLCTLYQLVGSPINCVNPSGVIPTRTLEVYCWVQGTFTVPSSHASGELSHPNVGPYGPGEETLHHSFYMWVPFVLTLEALLFHFPHALWKYWDDRNFSSSSHLESLLHREKFEKHLELLSVYFERHLSYHNSWYTKYVLCEAMNLLMVVANWSISVLLLGKKFLYYGVEVLRYLSSRAGSSVDPMTVLFPRMTKCTFQAFGPSGSVQIFDSLCILAINIMNEKIFLILWLWFALLLLLNVLTLLYRTAYTVSYSFRKRLLFIRLTTVDPKTRERFTDTVLRRFGVGDWFLFHNLLRCMDLDGVHVFVRKLIEQFERSGQPLQERSLKINVE